MFHQAYGQIVTSTGKYKYQWGSGVTRRNEPFNYTPNIEWKWWIYKRYCCELQIEDLDKQALNKLHGYGRRNQVVELS